MHLQISSRETSERMSSRRAGSCWPQASREAGWIRSSNSGEMGVKTGVPVGKTEEAQAEEDADEAKVGVARSMVVRAEYRSGTRDRGGRMRGRQAVVELSRA